MNETTEKLLPEKLSDCIDVALADLEKVEADEWYVVDMNAWHEPLCDAKNMKCSVCFAGAVISMTMMVPSGVDSDPWKFCEHNKARLRALDDIRCGWIQSALSLFRISLPAEMPHIVSITRYDEDAGEFKSDMKKIAAMLREHGL